MKLYIFILLGIALFVVSTQNVSAIAVYCGDGYCDNMWSTYNESNILSTQYCPQDCGIMTTAEWCENTYGFITESDCPARDCPACNCGTSVCDTSRISPTTLQGWCIGNGYTSGNSGFQSNKYYWLIFLVIGAVIGYYYAKRKK